MAHLWIEQDSEAWQAMGLSEEVYVLNGSCSGFVPLTDGSTGTALLVRGTAREKQWVLLARLGAKIRVNGLPLILGTRVLRDRDEVLFSAEDGTWRRCYFSTQEIAHVEPFPAELGSARCPRCKQPLDVASPAVRCPGCGTFHHQSEESPCWTYGEKCALCEQPTDLQAGYHWIPQQL